jgi:hypothetical protein
MPEIGASTREKFSANYQGSLKDKSTQAQSIREKL